jgi:hypothetical protein
MCAAAILFRVKSFSETKNGGICVSSRTGEVANCTNTSALEEAPTPFEKRPRVSHVVGPKGSRLTITDLPTPETKRWGARRKAELVVAIRGELISLEEACSRYKLTVEELLSWQESFDKHGVHGLRIMGTKTHRPRHRHRS